MDYIINHGKNNGDEDTNLTHNFNYRGYDIWEYMDTSDGVKYYMIYVNGVPSNYESLASTKAAINCYIINEKKKEKLIYRQY